MGISPQMKNKVYDESTKGYLCYSVCILCYYTWPNFMPVVMDLHIV